MLHDYFFVSKKQDDYIRTIWPRTTREAHDFRRDAIHRVSVQNEKPTTFILKSRNKLAKNISFKNKGIGVRLPKDELLIKIIKKINIPLVSTSLNISGQQNISSVKNLEKYFKIQPDLVVDTGVNKKTKGSRIIDIRDLDDVKIIRK